MAAIPCKDIFIIGAKRTAFRKYGGSLRELPASKAFAAAAKDAMHSANVDPNIVDATVVGNVFFLSQCDGGKTARYCGLYSGVPIERPALGVNKACGSGIQAVINGALDILTGMSKVSLTGGTEIMSTLPLLVRNVRFGTSLGQPLQLEDIIKKQFVDSHTGLSLQRIAENIAIEHGITREDVDLYAWNSYLKWKAAQEAKVFDAEITPITVKHKKKEVIINNDDVPDITKLEDLKSKSPILEDGSVVTESNSSLPADGASALILSDKESCIRHNLEPLARVSAWATVGVSGAAGGAGGAARLVMGKLGLKAEQVDLFELNENFASETLATIKALDIDPGKVNVHGGALSVGNPAAATGARMLTHLVHQMRNTNKRRCIAASSCGVGQGVAVVLEKP